MINPELYRFKTAQEFEKEFGKEWEMRINWNKEGMYYLLGQRLLDVGFTIKFGEWTVPNRSGFVKGFSTWQITNNHIILDPIPQEVTINLII